jgi:hypothetical protein
MRRGGPRRASSPAAVPVAARADPPKTAPPLLLLSSNAGLSSMYAPASGSSALAAEGRRIETGRLSPRWRLGRRAASA